MAGINLTPTAILSDVAFGINLLNGSVQTDVVGIFDQDSFEQVFINARPLKANVRETSKVMDYPVESGAILSDHHIINPITIELPMVISAIYYAEAYQQIRNAFLNATKLSVQTRTGVYQNMIIAEMPHDEDAEMFDAIALSLRLREVIFIVPSTSTQPNNYKPLDPENQNTVSRGFQLASAFTNQTTAAISNARAANIFGVRF